MESNAQKSFVRWQGITRDYFTAVSNLVLGLSTGLLAFLLVSLLSKPATTCISVIGTVSLIFLGSSISIAIWCAINRLRDFQFTTKIARARSRDKPISSESRLATKVMGKLSWNLFWCQLVLFAFGAAGVSVAVIARLWQ